MTPDRDTTLYPGLYPGNTKPYPGDLTLYLGRDAAGRGSEWWWRDQHKLVLPGFRLSTWVVDSREGSRLICRRLPAATPGDSRQAEKLLDNEIRALSRLAQRYGPAGYPAELPQLVGYNFDAVDPFALCALFRGSCAEHSARDLLSDQRVAFAVGLLRALAQLSAVGLVHGAVGLSTTWWDGARVQLVNFECAAVAGEPRRLADHSRWASPDQVLGTGRAHPGDDVFSAGLALYELFTGTRPTDTRATGAHQPDLTAGGPLLRELLAGVFQADAHRRPSALELLRRLSTGGDLPTPMDVEAGLRAGRARFEQARRAKYPSGSEPPPAAPAPTAPTAPTAPAAPAAAAAAAAPDEPPPSDPEPATRPLVLPPTILATTILATTPATTPAPSAPAAWPSSVRTALVVGLLTVFVVLLVLAVLAKLL